MGRLIRLDRSGHTTLAEWTARREAASEAAATAFRASSTSGWSPRYRIRTGPPRWCASCRSTPSWWCCGGRSPAAEPTAGRRADARRSGRPRPAARRGGAARLARGRERAHAAPRRASVDGVDVLDRRRLLRARRAADRDRAADLPVARDLLRARLGDPVAAGAPRRAPGGPDRRRAQRRARRAARTATRSGSRSGCSATCVGHDERELLAATGLALQRGELGAWLVGEQGAFLVRRGGRRVDCWCVRVAETAELPAGRPGRAPAAGAARGRARLREGREPGLLGRALAGARGSSRSGRGRRSTRRASWSPPSRSAARGRRSVRPDQAAAVVELGVRQPGAPPRRCSPGRRSTRSSRPSRGRRARRAPSPRRRGRRRSPRRRRRARRR